MNTGNIPAHVPAALVRDFNYFDMRGETDLFQHFHKWQDGPDIFYSPYFGGHWVLTRYDDIEYVLNNAEDFSSRYQTTPPNPSLVTMIEHDGQLHKDFRAILQPFFTPKNIGALEKVATELTVSLIEGFYAKGECEFTSEFALKMPIIIVMSLCELPQEDTQYLLEIVDKLTRSGDAEQQAAAFGHLFGYLGEKIIPARTANPGRDMISAIITGKVDGGRSPTPEEIVGLCGLLVIGGLDTVASMLGFITLFLANNPAHRRRLIEEPAILNPAIEEMMRRHHIANVARVAARDVEYKGITIKKGDIVLTATSFAGVDERHFPNAMTVDFDRADKKSLVFGRGPHQCIGSFLARTELRVFLTEWLKRIPDFEVKAGETPISLPGKANRVQYLPLTWKTV
ncbi:cytochrome P450 [Acidocella aquatica]|uniref:Cytochrome P450 n=1 Tax=Acidocella aquatica TaxID=1922313 RepID=A0ABQ5ZYY3_9PROT|nr:cytochrome P450 [Acidocella aquatica]GLR65436.1 cytochrome P450 [Acidocella aquatica]